MIGSHLRLTSLIASSLLLLAGNTVSAISLPPPTGPYSVGITKRAIEHYNDKDPLAPNNVSTAFLATIFYPTLQVPGNGSAKPYLNPETITYLAQRTNHSADILASITSTLQENAPFLPDSEIGGSPFPTLLFGPGGAGPPVEGSTILLSELASHGYTVIGLDHPFEAPFLRYPNGTGVVGVSVDTAGYSVDEAIHETRLVDTSAFLDYLPTLVEELGAPFSTESLGTFGLSLGGSAAVASLLRPGGDKITSSLNLDGTFWGALNTSAADVHHPVLLLGNLGHGYDETHTGDATWANFQRFQTGSYYARILIASAMHHDFADDAFFKVVESGVDNTVGPIDGLRMINVTRTYIKVFFDYTLMGKSSALLEGPSPEISEATYCTQDSVSCEVPEN